MKITAILVPIVFLLNACSSKLVVQSEPSPATVYLSVTGKADRVKVGDTPLELTETQIAETLKLSPESSQWVEFTFEKKDFETKSIFLPSNRWGEMSRIVKVKMNASDSATTTATKILKFFFNAKKFVETRQYESAHQEIDKVLAIDSQNSQAMTMKAGIYYLQSNIDEARKLYKKALEIDPGSSDAIKMLEKIQKDQGNVE